MPASATALALLRDIDLARRIVADQHDREAGHEAVVAAPARCTAAATLPRSSAAMALPSMMRAVMVRSCGSVLARRDDLLQRRDQRRADRPRW